MSARPMLKSDTLFWVVTDPTPESVIEDVLFKSNLAGLQLQILDGLRIIDRDVTVYAYGSQAAATSDAERRLVARDASEEDDKTDSLECEDEFDRQRIAER